jgi:hypothetical protein
VPQAPAVQACVSAGAPAAKLQPSTKNSSKVDHRVGQPATVQIKPVIFTLPHYTSAESFFSCCGSVAALASANCNEHVAEAIISAPAHTQRALHGARSSRGNSGKIT